MAFPLPVPFNDIRKEFTFVVCVKGNLFDPPEAIRNAQVELCSEFYRSCGFSTDDRPDVWLADAYDPVRNGMDTIVINVFLLLVDFPDCFQQLCLTVREFQSFFRKPFNDGKIAADELQLCLDGSVDGF